MNTTNEVKQIINEKSIKLSFFNKIIEALKYNLITNFYLYNENNNNLKLFDFTTSEKELNKGKKEFLNNNNIFIYLNSKNEKKFFKNIDKNQSKKWLPFYRSIISEKKGKNLDKVIIKNGRVIEFEISKHSIERFIERLLIFYKKYGYRKYDVSPKLKEEAKYIIKEIKDTKDDNEFFNKNKEYIKNLILNYLNKGDILHEKNIYKKRDIYNLKIRKEKYKDEENSIIRIKSHPFLFIINIKEQIIKTIELFTQSFADIDLLNKKSKDFANNHINTNILFKLYLEDLNKYFNNKRNYFNKKQKNYFKNNKNKKRKNK